MRVDKFIRIFYVLRYPRNPRWPDTATFYHAVPVC